MSKSRCSSGCLDLQLSQQFGSGYPGPHCKDTITIQIGSKQTTATIMDEVSGNPIDVIEPNRHLNSAPDALMPVSTFRGVSSTSSRTNLSVSSRPLGGSTALAVMLPLHLRLLRLLLHPRPRRQWHLLRHRLVRPRQLAVV